MKRGEKKEAFYHFPRRSDEHRCCACVSGTAKQTFEKTHE